MTRHHRHFPEGASAMMRIMTILGAGLIGLITRRRRTPAPLILCFRLPARYLPQAWPAPLAERSSA
jgi:hypothetical protein